MSISIFSLFLIKSFWRDLFISRKTKERKKEKKRKLLPRWTEVNKKRGSSYKDKNIMKTILENTFPVTQLRDKT
jgi:hypothetical protein